MYFVWFALVTWMWTFFLHIIYLAIAKVIHEIESLEEMSFTNAAVASHTST